MGVFSQWSHQKRKTIPQPCAEWLGKLFQGGVRLESWAALQGQSKAATQSRSLLLQERVKKEGEEKVRGQWRQEQVPALCSKVSTC